MDPLALAAATALVGAMATQSWEAARTSVMAWWRHVHPASAAGAEADLAVARADVLRARESGNTELEEALATQWQGKMGRLLAGADPNARTELQRVLEQDLAPMLLPTEQTRIRDITVTITQQGQGNTANVAGGNQKNVSGR